MIYISCCSCGRSCFFNGEHHIVRISRKLSVFDFCIDSCKPASVSLRGNGFFSRRQVYNYLIAVLKLIYKSAGFINSVFHLLHCAESPSEDCHRFEGAVFGYDRLVIAAVQLTAGVGWIRRITAIKSIIYLSS